MNTTCTRTKFGTAVVGAAIAGVAASTLLSVGAGTAQSDTPSCHLPQIHWPAACTDQIAIPQPPAFAQLLLPPRVGWERSAD